MNKFKPDNQELWDLCMKHGSIIARREKVTQSAILDMYDEINQLQNKTFMYYDETKLQECCLSIKSICKKHGADDWNYCPVCGTMIYDVDYL